ncbi:hypothetical protein VKT23_014057 [Stygiomarasmius scandens]|uniref:CxC1-like cysteine cluster associated with KDZ transposases domain-containing protein n=1 Tax=Marasmiellus scandens TaxID=2682957 RepID=A0ABR1J1I0_9AGAR
MGRSRGVSKSVKYGCGGGRFGIMGSSQRIGIQKRIQARHEAEVRYIQNVSGLSQQSQNALNELAGGQADIVAEDSAFMDMGFGFNDEDHDHDHDHPREHADSTDPDNTRGERLFYDLRDAVNVGRHRYLIRPKIKRQRKDRRTWRNRLDAVRAKWDTVIDPLTDAYIGWKYDSSAPDSTPAPTAPEYSFTINVLNIYDLAQTTTIQRDEKTPASIALVNAGFLGNAPEQPSVAVSLRTLELLFSIKLHKASFSIEAFARVLCHQYGIPYCRFHRIAISNCFDIFLELRCKVDKRVAAVLGHDTPNYRVLNSCPACTYKLKDEVPLKFSRMWVCDGNNSLRRMGPLGGRRVADTRVFSDSDYFLPSSFVDAFANEVKSRPKDPALDADDDEEEGLEDGGDPTDGSTAEHLAKCTKNWKAARADAEKRIWNIFVETGLFASACRHGFILWLMDMVMSGELAKYPLALVAKALELFDDEWVLGYDIGCSFSSTVNASSLGPEFRRRRCRTCVNAFHGYSHNFLCQLFYHPLNIPGMGLEDLETLERIFSASNQLAGITRYATGYRRRVLIDLFFRQWDDEKYHNIARMLHNNYIQALETINTEGQELSKGLAAHNLTTDDLDKYFEDEAQHFQNLGKEKEEDLHAVAYVELLQNFREVSKLYDNASSSFRTQTPIDYQNLLPAESYNVNMSATRKIETARRFLSEKRDQLHFELVQLECSMNIPEGQRWKPTDPQYLDTLKYMNNREYQQALEHLHKLVIQRLYELHRLNLSQTGYKMRTHIASALQKRSKAIRKAVKRYNAAALALQPPRATLDWTKISHFSFLDQFNILQDSRHTLFDKAWSKPTVRELMKKHHRVCRAREEIIRCNVELRRLHTSIIDEHRHFDRVVTQLKEESSALLGPVQDYVERRRRVNRTLLQQIQQTYKLEGFSGLPSPGTRLNAPEENSAGPSQPSMQAPMDTDMHTSASSMSQPTQDLVSPLPTHIDTNTPCDDRVGVVSDDSDLDDQSEDDDDLQTGVENMVDFISNLSVHD